MLERVRVSATTAKFKLYHDASAKCMLDNAFYRELEMDQKWKSAEIRKGTDEIVLLGLTPNTEYEVVGQYHVPRDDERNKQSETKIFTTFDERNKASVVFAYWLRTIMSDVNMSYAVLVDLVWRYYLMPQFEWDIKRTHRDFTLSTNRLRFTKSMTGRKSLCSKTMLDSAEISYVRWEMTMQQKGSDMYLLMGFIDARYIERWSSDQPIGRNKNETALFVADGYHPSVCNGRETMMDDQPTFKRLSFLQNGALHSTTTSIWELSPPMFHRRFILRPLLSIVVFVLRPQCLK